MMKSLSKITLAFVVLCVLLSSYGSLPAQDDRDLQSGELRKSVSAQAGTAVGSSDEDRQVLSVEEIQKFIERRGEKLRWRPHRIDLAPAKWIWLPSKRTLPNTFVLFRREVELDAAPIQATGWITADSRYRLTVNGQRVQWGPAPCDPRQLDVEPLDITAHLRPGKNVIGVEVLYYGIGDGTWAAGKPGLLFHASIKSAGGEMLQIVSDSRWRCVVDRAHPPA